MKLIIPHRRTCILLTFALMAIAGCRQETIEFFINPDGSGKVTQEITVFAPTYEIGNTRSDYSEDQGQMVVRTIAGSAGVDAWTDVSFGDETPLFNGTALFPDIEKLKLHSVFKLSALKNQHGEMIIELDIEDPEDRENKNLDVETILKDLSEADLNRAAQKAKSDYEEVKEMMSGLLATIHSRAIFHLPGKIKQISNFDKTDNRTVEVSLQGEKLFEIVDARMTDDAWLKEQIRRGKDPMKETFNFKHDHEMNKVLFGQKGPIRVVCTLDSDSLFDYDAELGVARVDYQKIIKEFGLEDPEIIMAPNTLVPTVGQVGSSVKTDKDRCRLSLSVKLPQEAIEMTGGQIKKALTATGKDLVLSDPWPEHIEFLNLGQDRRVCDFTAYIRVPDRQEQLLKELSGELEYLAAAGSKKLDSGIIEFKRRVKSKDGEFAIREIERRWEDSRIMTLNVMFPKGSLRSARLYDENGVDPGAVEGPRSYMAGKLRTIRFEIDGRFPPKGRIVLDVYKDVKKHRAVFRATDIPLQYYERELGVDQETGALIAGIRDVVSPESFGNGQYDCSLPLMVRFPKPIMDIGEVIFGKVTSSTGANLLPSDYRWTRCARLRNDRRTALFDIQMPVLSNPRTLIREITGTLDYYTWEGTRKIDSGLITFNKGLTIEKVGLEIASIERKRDIRFKLTVPPRTIQSIKFYSKDGTELQMKRSYSDQNGDTWYLLYDAAEDVTGVKQKLPPEGRMVFEMAKDFKEHRINFVAKNILIDGDKYKQHKW